MTQVTDMLKKELKKQVDNQFGISAGKFGSESGGDFAVAKSKLMKDISKLETNEEEGYSPQIGKTQGLTPEVLTKILTKIAKDIEDEEEMSKEETKEAMGAASAGGYVAPLFSEPQKRKIKETEERIKGGLADNMSLEDLANHHDTDIETIIEKMEEGVNVEMEHTSEMLVAFEIAMDHIYEDLNYYDKLKKIEGDSHKEEAKEATTSASVGVYDAPIGGGRKDPLQIDTPKSVYSKLNSVTNPNFPKYGGKGGKYVKVKDKCKKFPYCNQGDIKALEFFENNLVKEAIKRVSTKYNLDKSFIEGLIIERLNK